MKQKTNLARLMKMSWQIQKSKHFTRSKSLQAAWAILINEDIAIYYLVQRLSKNRPVKQKTLSQFSIFTH